MIIEVSSRGWLSYGGRRIRCTLGAAGVTSDKHEGDGATPRGEFPLRRILYRKDHLPPPKVSLPIKSIAKNDGWCDDPDDSLYNQQVTLPYNASCESLWHDQGLYDLIVVLGHNDDPVVVGRGSAIFLHIADEDFSPTKGCVAIPAKDLVLLVEAANSSTIIRII